MKSKVVIDGITLTREQVERATIELSKLEPPKPNSLWRIKLCPNLVAMAVSNDGTLNSVYLKKNCDFAALLVCDAGTYAYDSLEAFYNVWEPAGNDNTD